MLDIKLFRENPEIIIESEKKRFKDVAPVYKVIELDKKWRTNLQKLEELRRLRNTTARNIAKLKKEGKDIATETKKMKDINNEISNLEAETDELLVKRDEYRYIIGNILAEDVPIAEDESGNVPIRFWGSAKVAKEDFERIKRETQGKMNLVEISHRPKSHVDIIKEWNLADIDKAAEVSGARFYYLKNDLVRLNLAIIQYALDTLIGKGFTPMWTPFMLRKEFMKKAAELADFEETLYSVGDEHVLIATAEQTLAAYHSNETFEEAELPKAYAGFSTNFRREAGAHGKDTKGIFRVHQFDKVEQYVYCLPEDSPEWHKKMIANVEELFQGLEIPYQIVNIASGDLNDTAAIKYDLEAWMPAQGTFREMASGSNCTDYQSRKLNVKVRRRNGETQVVHVLNCTGIATERAIVAIIENHQEDNVIKIPKALQQYMGGQKEIRKPE